MTEQSPHDATIELWGGVECTVNRVGEQYFDQCEMSGHDSRLGDLELFADLGISAIRYPVLWERTAPRGLATADWSWADERLGRLRELGIRPIVGLVHHGSGPKHTSLVDSTFPEQLAAFAQAVAARYPWVEAYTPVNEPLTTARFSGLYGHWYPHATEGLAFARALLVQCRAVALSMRAIRRVNPAAQLVQTEDLGKTFSTRTLAYQAAFENERRWLTFDLLAGRVGRGHSMWDYLRWLGIEEAELDWFVANPCPPDTLGINHYLTSERFLDERLERYPDCARGGNGRHSYADVEAVRVCAEGPAGPRKLLREVWERYGLPLAVTEVHLGCTREEQLRWLKEVWDAALALRREGADVRAVTTWSLLGAYDWNSLVTRREGRYEPGVFDLRSPQPRPTALAALARELADGREPDHPLLESPGWWRRLDRLCYPPVKRLQTTSAEQKVVDVMKGSSRPLIITGATGTLGGAFARACAARAISYRLLSRREMDIADADSVQAALTEWQPWAVVNAAGYVRVDEAEHEEAACHRENTVGAATLASNCAQREIQLLTFSSDLVFDGTARKPYVESDAVAPLGVYGRSKAEAEARVMESHPAALVIRASAFFGPWDEYNFVTVALRTLAAGQTFVAADDAFVSPTYLPDLTNACLDLLIDGERGLWHLANTGKVTWAELARRAAQLAGMKTSLVKGKPTDALGLMAQRPLYSVLGSERGVLLPSLESALGRYFDECQARWATEIDANQARTSQQARVKFAAQ
ncbi:MAG: dTDP-4-dehydrorhamnose reductase [Blastocatellia bacterium]|nr:dTDP-4-dehydrorhamnose reductase [Blastocatellia bacterium]